jgi:hypothetical protein
MHVSSLKKVVRGICIMGVIAGVLLVTPKDHARA